jgi:hypothetical protein
MQIVTPVAHDRLLLRSGCQQQQCELWQAKLARALPCTSSVVRHCWMLVCLQASAGLRTLCAAKVVMWLMPCTLQALASLNMRCVGFGQPGSVHASRQWECHSGLPFTSSDVQGLGKLLHVVGSVLSMTDNKQNHKVSTGKQQTDCDPHLCVSEAFAGPHPCS